MEQTASPTTIGILELTDLLEPLIRKVVREELAQIVTRRPNTFYLKPDSPLRDDMVEILKRKQRGEITLHSHAETWGE